ncbi:MAG: hypothetical protein WCK18_07510 [Prolixibacteraceae bacterium]
MVNKSVPGKISSPFLTRRLSMRPVSFEATFICVASTSPWISSGTGLLTTMIA